MKNILLFLGFFLLSNMISGQTERIYRKYVTQKIDRLGRENASIQQRKKAVEHDIYRYQKMDNSAMITIPVLFHNLYYNETQRVSEALITSQLEALNAAFRLERNWEHVGHDLEGWDKIIPKETGIQFCLGDVDLMSNGQKGINYVATDETVWDATNAIKTKKFGGVVPHQPTNYLNVWIADLGATTAGFAQMPWGDNHTDGIVINYRFFGLRGDNAKPYHLGKTLVHLVGNYLGLYDLWSDTRICQDDRIGDTPIHNGPNYGPQEVYRHFSICNGGNQVEQTPNYMDATDDAHTYFFTYGQVARMHAVLRSPSIRKGLTDGNEVCTNKDLIVENTSRSNINNKVTLVTEKTAIKLAPNPAKAAINITIEGNFTNLELVISDMAGRLVYQLPIGKVEHLLTTTLDCSSWLSGIYFIRSTDGQLNQKFIVSK